MVKLGCRYFMSLGVAPEVSGIYEKWGYTCIAEASYTEEGEEYSMSPEEFESKKHLFTRFKDGIPVVKLWLKDFGELNTLDHTT